MFLKKKISQKMFLKKKFLNKIFLKNFFSQKNFFPEKIFLNDIFLENSPKWIITCCRTLGGLILYSSMIAALYFDAHVLWTQWPQKTNKMVYLLWKPIDYFLTNIIVFFVKFAFEWYAALYTLIKIHKKQEFLIFRSELTKAATPEVSLALVQ